LAGPLGVLEATPAVRPLREDLIMTKDFAALASAVREAHGEDIVDLLVWADAWLDKDDGQSSDVLRMLPEILSTFRNGLGGGDGVDISLDSINIWFDNMGDWCINDTTNLRAMLTGRSDAFPVLLARWNDLHPAIEWLAKKLGFSVVEVSFEDISDEAEITDPFPKFALSNGKHLKPFPGCDVDSCSFRQPHRQGSNNRER
jgi:hypothetical protein